MKKIDSMSFSRLRNDEVFGLFQRVLSLGQVLLTQEMDAAILALYKKAVDDFDASLKQDIKLKETEIMEAADKYVDEVYRGLKHHIRAQMLHPDLEKRKEAKTVMNILDKYGFLIRLPYNQQYGALHNSIQELTALSTEMQTSLSLGPWLEGLALAFAKFTSAREAQTKEKATYQVRLVKECRIAAEQAHRNFIHAVNTFAITFGEEKYASFIDQVNIMIADAKIALKQRITRAENEKEENEENVVDTDNTENSGTTDNTGNTDNGDNSETNAA